MLCCLHLHFLRYTNLKILMINTHVPHNNVFFLLFPMPLDYHYFQSEVLSILNHLYSYNATYLPNTQEQTQMLPMSCILFLNVSNVDYMLYNPVFDSFKK